MTWTIWDTTWVQFPEPTWWKGKTYSCKLSSMFHMHAMTYTYPHFHTQNTKKICLENKNVHNGMVLYLTYFFNVLCIWVFCLPVYHMHACCLWRPRSPRTGVTDGYELPCRWWELNLGFAKKQALLITSEAISPPTPFCFYRRHWCIGTC